jgi:hypothetical protein
MWLTLALRHWYWIVIGCLTFALSLSTLHGRALKAERDAKIAEIDFMAREAQAFNERSSQRARQINDEIPVLVEQARKTAYANYKAKYGANAACGISGRLPNMPAGIGEADSTGSVDEASTDPMADFAGQCAETTMIATQFQAWARANNLEVQ